MRLGFDAKSQLIPARDVHLICPLPAGVDPPQRLGALPWHLSRDQLLQARPSRRAWSAAWLLLLEAEQTFSLRDFTDLVYGDQQPVHCAACWLELMGAQLMFRLKQGVIAARSGHDLRRLRQERRRSALQEQRLHAWQQQLLARQPLCAEALAEEQRRWLTALTEVASHQREWDALDPGLRQSLAPLHLSQDRGQLRHLLVELGHWDPHQLASMAATPWSRGFSAELLEEAERLMAEAERDQPGDALRRDLTHLRCVTIDDDDTLDIDDALALEHGADGRCRIWIHVADPGRLIQANSPLDCEARRRGSSLYLAQGTLPMFPANLSHGPLSLRQGIRSAAWSIWAELDEHGDLADYGLCRSWICPTYRLSYEDADDLIELAPPQEAELAELEGWMQRRRRWRLSRGGLQLDLAEGRIRCVDGEACVVITEPSASRSLVAEAMILAGAVVAQFAAQQGLALPYRSQLPAELPPAAELQALPDGPVRYAAIKRCLSRGLVGTQPAAHFSLGLAAYVQATSPIRRYGDLVVQRQLADLLSGQPPLDAAQLQELIDVFDASVRQGLAIAREDQRHWQQVWFANQRGQQWGAQFLRWLRPQDHLGLVRIESVAMDLAAECPGGSKPGDQLLLRVHQVDPLRDQLRLLCSAS